MKRILSLIFMMVLVLGSVTGFASSTNGVDKVVAVKDDYEFKPGNAFVKLKIEETSANDFGGTTESFIVELENAEWFEDGDVNDVSKMITDVTVSGSMTSTISISRLSKRKIEIELTRGNDNTDKEAAWRIPIYAAVTGEGDVNVIIDGRDGQVSSSTHKIADARGSGSSNITVGYRYDQSSKYWLTVTEPEANAFKTDDQIFRLELSASEWFETTDTKLSPESMQDDAIMGGVEYAELKSIERISDKVIEITLNRGEKSSLDGMASWSIPLYHVVTEAGEIKIDINTLNSMVNEGTFTKDPVKLDVIESIEKLRLQIGSTSLVTMEGQFKSSKELDVAPVNPSGTTLVPLRGILEALGAEVVWHGETQQIDINKADLEVTLTIGAQKAIVNGIEVELSEPAQIVNSRTLIPLRFVSESLGYKVDWNGETQEIDIYEQ